LPWAAPVAAFLAIPFAAGAAGTPSSLTRNLRWTTSSSAASQPLTRTSHERQAASSAMR
jgi:hypothetical protein